MSDTEVMYGEMQSSDGRSEEVQMTERKEEPNGDIGETTDVGDAGLLGEISFSGEEASENADSEAHSVSDDADASSESGSAQGEEDVNGDMRAMRAEIRREVAEELAEFRELYPEIPYGRIPEAVRKSELPLAAAYALYEKKAEHLRALAETENRKNTERTAGGLQQSADICYTPAEVRQMTRAEIRANYDSILRSMQRWKSE